MPTVTIKMTDAQFEALAREAKKRGSSKAGILREAFLQRQHGQPASDSAYDLVADIVGSVEGPTDLATNPKYLKGYGRPRVAGEK